MLGQSGCRAASEARRRWSRAGLRNSLVVPARHLGARCPTWRQAGLRLLVAVQSPWFGLRSAWRRHSHGGADQALGVEGLCVKTHLDLGGKVSSAGPDEELHEPFAGRRRPPDGALEATSAGSGEVGDVVDPEIWWRFHDDPVRQGPRRGRGALRAGGQNTARAHQRERDTSVDGEHPAPGSA